MTYIDAKGLACPQPVLLAKKALDRGETALTVAVDNPAAVENLRRLAASQGREVTVRQSAPGWELIFTAPAPAQETEATEQKREPETAEKQEKDLVVFISRETLGQGDDLLGANLMKMFLYTLAQSERRPGAILFINGGVKLPAGDQPQVVDSLRRLADRGCQLLVCGACLNFYGLTEQLQAGQVSNMYDIVDRMQRADRVINI